MRRHLVRGATGLVVLLILVAIGLATWEPLTATAPAAPPFSRTESAHLYL